MTKAKYGRVKCSNSFTIFRNVKLYKLSQIMLAKGL